MLKGCHATAKLHLLQQFPDEKTCKHARPLDRKTIIALLECFNRNSIKFGYAQLKLNN